MVDLVVDFMVWVNGDFVVLVISEFMVIVLGSVNHGWIQHQFNSQGSMFITYES